MRMRKNLSVWRSRRTRTIRRTRPSRRSRPELTREEKRGDASNDDIIGPLS
jgi:hypothetical protein